MSVRILMLSAVVMLMGIVPAYADHPKGNIDAYMKAHEPYFQVIDLPSAPPFELIDAKGNKVRLSDFKNKVVVLNFTSTHCQNGCERQAAVIADIQQKVNITPLKADVQFITISADLTNDAQDAMKNYAQTHGFGGTNWLFLTASKDANVATTRTLIEAYNIRAELAENDQETEGVVTHVIDKGGRFAAKFHGLKFGPINLILYISGIIDN
jgi:protein SCO1/2